MSGFSQSSSEVLRRETRGRAEQIRLNSELLSSSSSYSAVVTCVRVFLFVYIVGTKVGKSEDI